MVSSVADPDPGSGACALLTLDPGSGIGSSGSWILTDIFDSLMKNFWVTIILSVLAKKKYLCLFQNNIIYNFIIFEATKNGSTKRNFPSSLLVLLLDSGSRMDKNQDPGSGINILFPQH